VRTNKEKASVLLVQDVSSTPDKLTDSPAIFLCGTQISEQVDAKVKLGITNEKSTATTTQPRKPASARRD